MQGTKTLACVNSMLISSLSFSSQLAYKLPRIFSSLAVFIRGEQRESRKYKRSNGIERFSTKSC